MKKVFISIILMLSLNFAFANETLNGQVSNEIIHSSELCFKNFTIEVRFNSELSIESIMGAPNCWVDIYYQGVYVGTEYSYQPSYDDCVAWANKILQEYAQQ